MVRKGGIKAMCKIEGCSYLCYAKTYCKKHYYQIKRTGKIRTIYPENCVSKFCERTSIAKGFCKKHYEQIRIHGELTPHREQEIPRRKKL